MSTPVTVAKPSRYAKGSGIVPEAMGVTTLVFAATYLVPLSTCGTKGAAAPCKGHLAASASHNE